MTTTLPRLVEDANPHDLEYPDIPSIPEENEEDSASSRGSPINFQEFSPDIDYPPVKPWKGILKKTTSATWNIDSTINIQVNFNDVHLNNHENQRSERGLSV